MELGQIEGRLKAARDTLELRLVRLYDGLEHLAATTRILLEETPASPDEVDAWVARELVDDADGYLARRRVLDAARRGEPDPSEFVFYVHQRNRAERDVLERMYRLRNLGRVLQPMRDRIGGLAWVYFQDPANWAISFPSHDPSKAIPADFDWLTYFTYAGTEPGANPEREIKWTPPNIDYGNLGLMVACSIPVYGSDDRFLGVWSIDVPVRGLLQAVDLDLGVPGAESFIVDRAGELVAHDRIEAVISPEKGAAYRARWTVLGGDFARLDATELVHRGQGRIELVDEAGQPRIGLWHTVPALEWMLWITAPTSELLEGQRRVIREAFERVGQGDLGVRLEATSDPGLAALTRGFNEMAEQLQTVLDERARTQQQLQQAQRVQAIGQLASKVAHDFNNLLTAIIGYSEMIIEDGDPMTQEMAGGIKEAADRAAALTGQLLAFARREVVERRPTSVADVLKRSAPVIERLISEGLTLDVEIAPQIPPVFADEAQLVQVFMNLIINAGEAMGGTGRIEVQLREVDGDVIFVVSDEGPGIPDAVRGRIFEPFFTTKSTGTGLGLAAVRGIVDDMSGRIELTRSDASGTTFTLTLPGMSILDDLRAAAFPPTSRTRLDGRRVLVLDDDPLVRRSARVILERAGAEVFASGSADVILEEVAATSRQLLVTDVRMPRVGGREVARRAREIDPNIAVLFVTGYTDDTLLLEGIHADRERVLRKPFGRSQLVTAVMRAFAEQDLD